MFVIFGDAANTGSNVICCNLWCVSCRCLGGFNALLTVEFSNFCSAYSLSCWMKCWHSLVRKRPWPLPPILEGKLSFSMESVNFPPVRSLKAEEVDADVPWLIYGLCGQEGKTRTLKFISWCSWLQICPKKKTEASKASMFWNSESPVW